MRSFIFFAFITLLFAFSGAETVIDSKRFAFRLPPFSRPKQRILVSKFEPYLGNLPPFLSDAKLSLRIVSKSSHKITAYVKVTSPSLGAEGHGWFTARTIWSEFSGVFNVHFRTPRIHTRIFVRGTLSGGFIGLGTAVHKFTRPNGVRLVRSKISVTAGVSALKAALEANPNGPRLVATIDHAAAARKVGLALAESTVVVFGRPQIGAPLWRQTAQIGIELPIEMLVAVSPLGVGYVAYNGAFSLAKRFKVTIPAGLPAAFANFARIAAGLEKLYAEPAGFDVAKTQFLEGIAEQSGKTTAAAAYARLIAALTKAPPVNIAYSIEHDKSAVKEGISVESENKVAVFGNPKLGTPLMQQSFTAALDLPAKIGVWDLTKGTDTAYVGYVKPNYIATRHGADLQPTLTTALGNFAKVAIGA